MRPKTVLAVAMSGSVAFSAESATSPEHEAHGHSDDAPATNGANSSQFDAQHAGDRQKMMATKTQQEHAALVNEQKKTMLDGRLHVREAREAGGAGIRASIRTSVARLSGADSAFYPEAVG